MKIGTATVNATGETVDVVSALEDVPIDDTCIVVDRDGTEYVVSVMPEPFWTVHLDNV